MKNLLIVMLFCAACVQDSLSPESALKNFVEARMENVVTRQFILDHVTGKLKVSLENISEEEFNKFTDLRSVKKDSFKILSKSCQEKRCFLTYVISYQTKGASNFFSEVKKIAELVNEEGKWLIADVSNLKTYHEALEPINP